MPITFSDVMKKDLGIITKDKSKTVTVIIKTDGVVISDYGEKTKAVVSISTTAIINDVTNTKGWEGDGFMPGGDLRCKVWELEDGGIDYMTREYFSSDRVDNIQVNIGAIRYRVLQVEAPESISDVIPYMVFVLSKQEDVAS